MGYSLISKIVGVPTRIVEGDMAEIFPEEFEEVAKFKIGEEGISVD